MQALIDICEMDQSSRAAFQQLALTLHTPKQLHQGVDVQATETAAALVLVDSSTNLISCVRTAKKNDFDIMVRQSLQFTQVLGHAECNYICDNEPTILQVQGRHSDFQLMAKHLQPTRMETTLLRQNDRFW